MIWYIFVFAVSFKCIDIVYYLFLSYWRTKLHDSCVYLETSDKNNTNIYTIIHLCICLTATIKNTPANHTVALSDVFSDKLQ